jgi:hypothetical protein
MAVFVDGISYAYLKYGTAHFNILIYGLSCLAID